MLECRVGPAMTPPLRVSSRMGNYDTICYRAAICCIAIIAQSISYRCQNKQKVESPKAEFWLQKQKRRGEKKSQNFWRRYSAFSKFPKFSAILAVWSQNSAFWLSGFFLFFTCLSGARKARKAEKAKKKKKWPVRISVRKRAR